MKLFLDTGNIKDIETYLRDRIIDGVTTNRRSWRKSGRSPRDHEADLQIVKGPVSAEVPRPDVRGDVRRGARPGGDRPPRRDQGCRSETPACRPEGLRAEGIRR